jgi:hypothetical protein
MRVRTITGMKQTQLYVAIRYVIIGIDQVKLVRRFAGPAREIIRGDGDIDPC